MAQNDKIQLFEDKQIRTAWDEEKEEWYFSVIDVVAVLTDQPDYQAARNYWKVTKKRLKDEGNETVTSCNQLKMTASDGKNRLTDVADTEQLLRIIQSIPFHLYSPFRGKFPLLTASEGGGMDQGAGEVGAGLSITFQTPFQLSPWRSRL